LIESFPLGRTASDAARRRLPIMGVVVHLCVCMHVGLMDIAKELETIETMGAVDGISA